MQRDFPDISEAECRAAIQLVEPGGKHTDGAEAAFRTLSLGGHGRGWLFCYAHLPLFAFFSERLYHWVARHRGACYRVGTMTSY